jgi:hypothetical protein
MIRWTATEWRVTAAERVATILTASVLTNREAAGGAVGGTLVAGVWAGTVVVAAVCLVVAVALAGGAMGG